MLKNLEKGPQGWAHSIFKRGATCGHRKGGLTAFSKNFKMPFLRDIEKSFLEVSPIGPEPHHFFHFKIFQQIQWLEASKVLAKMGRGWQAD